MKKFNLLTVLIMLVFASVSFGQITGSAHDFKIAAWNSSGEICITCHTPHNADAAVNAPLWNHEMTVATFTMYSSTTLDATMDDQPATSSKLCLSCHDGTVALDSYGGATGATNITGVGLMGTDLSHEHPISFTYDSDLATTDGELFDPSSVMTSLGGTIDADLLSGGSMQCSSCHDVHNSANELHLLVIDNAASALCLTCHDK